MKAFLLAAGHGTRLRPYTDSVPKCLLPVRGVPMLEIWLNLCRRSGISDVLVNTHSHAGAVREFVGRWKDGVRVKVIEEPQLFGSAGTLRVHREWAEGDSSFWVFYADVLTTMDLGKMLRFHRPEYAATLGVYRVSDPERCGIVEVDPHDCVISFTEKPAFPKSNLAFAGILVGTQRLLDVIPEKQESDIGFDVLPRLSGEMRAYRVSDYLLDIGTLENYHLAQRTWPGLDDAA